jgi:hypothetical protein
MRAGRGRKYGSKYFSLFFPAQTLENLREMCEAVPLMRTASRKILFSCLAIISVSLATTAGTAFKPETSWKRYRNRQWGYCVSYPSRWYKGEAFEGSGIFVKTGVKRHSRPVGEIDVGALPNKAKDLDQPTPISLTKNFELHVEGLKKFERAERLEILEKRPLELSGSSALFTKDRYFDPQDGATWVDEIVLVDRGETLYRLELECRSDQLAKFEPVFAHFVSTFQFDCGGR